LSLPTKNEHYQDEVVRPITVKKQNKGKGDLINNGMVRICFTNQFMILN